MKKLFDQLFSRHRATPLIRHAALDTASMDSGSTAGMTKRKNAGITRQRGRSMIEMLGVLAIIWVLSIGGIALYRRAVNNHQANTILDDANRFAFVLTESNRAFSTSAFIDNVEYSKTSTYNLDAFLGAGAGQFGIVVTDVPKGVCEPLVDKAVIEYKVRVLPANTAESVVHISASGIVYDSFHKDICINDMNDVILYFGDTSAQCNKPEEEQEGIPCKSNAECCGTHFCAFKSTDSAVQGDGVCLSLDDYPGETLYLPDGRTYVRSEKKMSWWSVESYCQALGRRTVTRADIGCADVERDTVCSSDDSDLAYFRQMYRSAYNYWLEESPYDHWKTAYNTNFLSLITYPNNTIHVFYKADNYNPLCR